MIAHRVMMAAQAKEEAGGGLDGNLVSIKDIQTAGGKDRLYLHDGISATLLDSFQIANGFVNRGLYVHGGNMIYVQQDVLRVRRHFEHGHRQLCVWIWFDCERRSCARRR